jgi:hypothetical protein
MSSTIQNAWDQKRLPKSLCGSLLRRHELLLSAHCELPLQLCRHQWKLRGTPSPPQRLMVTRRTPNNRSYKSKRQTVTGMQPQFSRTCRVVYAPNASVTSRGAVPSAVMLPTQNGTEGQDGMATDAHESYSTQFLAAYGRSSLALGCGGDACLSVVMLLQPTKVLSC